jgi:Txe/YoeB family toxin of Txe-Axe toxin-antitoxin module
MVLNILPQTLHSAAEPDPLAPIYDFRYSTRFDISNYVVYTVLPDLSRYYPEGIFSAHNNDSY